MRAKRLIKILMIGCIILLAGCGKSVEVDEDDYVWDRESIPQHITEKIKDNVMIDADVIILPGFENGKGDVYKVTSKKLDRELIQDVLIKENSIVNTETERYGENEEFTLNHHLLENGDILSIGDTWFHYRSALADYISYCIRFGQGQDGNNVEKFEQNTENFAYMTLEEAEKECAETLIQLGVSIEKESYRSFRLAHETLSSEEEVIINPGLEEKYQPHPKENWTEEDDCYYFEFLPTVNGYSFVPDAYTTETERVRGIERSFVTYNNKGIVSMNSPDIFVIEDICQEQERLVSLQKAVSELKKKYEQTIVEGSIEISEIYLGNVALMQEEADEYETVPVWAFSIVEENENEGPRYFKRVINAITAKEIY